MKYFIVLLTALFSFINSNAQTAEDSVKIAVSGLFASMRNADPAALRSAFADSAILQTISYDKEGQVVIRNETVKNFADLIGREEKNAADEQVSFSVVQVDGPLATVWTPYRFFYKGAFSHCGVNSFQLVRLKGQWKIQYLIDTRRRKGCEE